MRVNLIVCAGRWMAVAGLLFCAMSLAYSQGSSRIAPDRSRPVKERVLPGGYPDKPSLPPVWTIPVEPLGFSPPGPLYLGSRDSLASLDFIDENRLLFTFRVPGLIHRQLQAGETSESDERRIRAVVLTLPTGAVEAEALWSVHDHARYLWMLKDGHFLFRDRDNLQQGDAHLDLKPLLHFPGPLLGVELDPNQQFLVSNSREPAAVQSKLGEVGSPATAAATVTPDNSNSSSDSKAGSDQIPPDMVVRILHRESGRVMLVSRVRSMVHLPINSEGYLESLRGRGLEWVLNLNFFTGGSRILGSVDSSCTPNLEFISQQEVLVTACNPSGGHKLVAITTDGKILWDDLNPDTAIWPLLTRSPDGLRVIQETLAVTHPVSSYAPLGSDDIKGQLIRIFDAATGEVAFESPAGPILDAGGNVAISPSSRRVSVLNAGAIQVFDLPAPPPLPNTAGKQPGR
ncbi:MAG TPA: hypothetical protein VGT08_20420 [Terracidiphilus sp.]|nr:hypothetical protein [Terracidiphilus sp.]